jgi:hypothetical protein
MSMQDEPTLRGLPPPPPPHPSAAPSHHGAHFPPKPSFPTPSILPLSEQTRPPVPLVARAPPPPPPQPSAAAAAALTGSRSFASEGFEYFETEEKDEPERRLTFAIPQVVPRPRPPDQRRRAAPDQHRPAPRPASASLTTARVQEKAHQYRQRQQSVQQAPEQKALEASAAQRPRPISPCPPRPLSPARSRPSCCTSTPSLWSRCARCSARRQIVFPHVRRVRRSRQASTR